MVDAVVIGAGHNGLVAANLLADAGWRVQVLEAAAEPGGAVRTAEITAPGFRNDLFSAFYPLGFLSPVLRSLDLERWGLRWVEAPLVLAHPTPGGPAVALSRNLDDTAGSLERFAPGDGDAWRRLYALWQAAGHELLDALTSPFPPVRAAGRLAAAIGVRRLPEFARLGVQSVRSLARHRFSGEGGALLLGGNAGHADIPMDSPGSGFFGWMMASMGQDVGFPAPEGGAGELTAALVRRLEATGGEVICDTRVEGIEVTNRRATAVRTVAGDVVAARRAVVADVSAPALYHDLVGDEHLSSPFRARLRWFRHGQATVKVDWALSTPVPWDDEDCRRAGTVHVADSFAELSATFRQLEDGVIPTDPFLLVGQMTTTDPTRSPPGTESLWAYTHLPQGVTWDGDDVRRFADRIEARIERHAPGFRDGILARHVLTPAAMEAENANLVGGDVMGGTSKLRQQLVLRPIPGLGRSETPIAGLYLASASAHPGGGVHGACGANAAKAALAHDRRRR